MGVILDLSPLENAVAQLEEALGFKTPTWSYWNRGSRGCCGWPLSKPLSSPIFQGEARFLLNQLQIRSTSLDRPC